MSYIQKPLLSEPLKVYPNPQKITRTWYVLQEPSGTFGNPSTVRNLLELLYIHLNLQTNYRNDKNPAEPLKCYINPWENVRNIMQEPIGSCRILQEPFGSLETHQSCFEPVRPFKEHNITIQSPAEYLSLLKIRSLKNY